MPSRQSRHSTLNWRSSRYSGKIGDCVEIASEDGSVLVRDSRQRSGPVLQFSPDLWSSFMKRLRDDDPHSAAG
jgi:hypothetical protein